MLIPVSISLSISVLILPDDLFMYFIFLSGLEHLKIIT